MSRKFTAGRRRTIAYHEAGHAVANHDLGARFIQVFINERPVDDMGGMVQNDTEDEISDRHNIVITLAGPYAQARHLKRSNTLNSIFLGDGNFDCLNAMQSAKYLEDASRVVSQVPWNVIFQIGEQETEKLVVRRWVDIELVAQALVQRGSLSYDEFLQVITTKDPIGAEIVREGFISGLMAHHYDALRLTDAG